MVQESRYQDNSLGGPDGARLTPDQVIAEVTAELLLQEALERAAISGVIAWSMADHVLRHIEVRQGIRRPGLCPDDDPELERLRCEVVVALAEIRGRQLEDEELDRLLERVP